MTEQKNSKMKAAKYKTKSCEIEAIQWNGLNLEEIKGFVGDSLIYNICDTAWEVGKGRPHVSMKIKTLEGDMQASEGDYIIKGLCGEFYPCKPDVFEKKYEAIGIVEELIVGGVNMTEQEAVEYLNRIYHQFTPLDEYGYVEDFEPYEKAINMAKESLEKQIPQSVKLYIGQDMQCPECNKRLRAYEGMKICYCKFCGQALER